MILCLINVSMIYVLIRSFHLLQPLSLLLLLLMLLRLLLLLLLILLLLLLLLLQILLLLTDAGWHRKARKDISKELMENCKAKN